MRFYYVISSLVIIHVVNAMIEWEIEKGPQGKPWALKCRGLKENGSWFKRWNNTDTTLATFDKNGQVTQIDMGFTITAYIKKSNLESRLSLPTGIFGTFGCKFGKEYHLFFLAKEIKTNSDSKPKSVTLQCQDIHPYNISWYLNSTFVALTIAHNHTSYVVVDRNTSFTQLKNVTFRNDQATTNNTRPVCLTCIVHSNDSYGSHTTCTPGTKDLASGHQTSSENFLRASLLQADQITNGNTNLGNLVSNATGLGFVIGSIAFVCAVAGLVLLTHVMGRRPRQIPGYEQRLYGPLSNSSGSIIERTTS